VDVASDGAEAIKMCREKSYNLIFMDLHMPICDGLEATRTLRAQGTMVPIVGLTASEDEETTRMGQLAGMTALLPKPITVQALKGVLDKFS